MYTITGECVRQYLMIRGTIWPMGVTKFCGINRDQHFYIEIDQKYISGNELSKTLLEAGILCKETHETKTYSMFLREGFFILLSKIKYIR